MLLIFILSNMHYYYYYKNLKNRCSKNTMMHFRARARSGSCPPFTRTKTLYPCDGTL